MLIKKQSKGILRNETGNINTTYSGVICTTFDKVILILKNTEKTLRDIGKEELSNDILYVISKIQTNSLYSYSIEEEIYKNLEKEDDMKSIFESLKEYSEMKKTYNNMTGFSNKNILQNSRREPKVRFKTYQVGKPNTSLFIDTPKANQLGKEGKGIGVNMSNDLLNNINHYNLTDISENNEGMMLKNTSIKLENDDQTKTSQEKEMNLDENNEIGEKAMRTRTTFKFSNKVIFPIFEDELLKKTNVLLLKKSFNTHLFYKEHKEKNPFLLLTHSIFNIFNLFDSFIENISRFDSFIDKIRSKYNKIPYHNEKHGIDVCISLFQFIHFAEDFKKKIKISDFEIICLLVSGLCHDIGHPGFNNSFQINSMSSFALTYNDKSVLENYHASESMKILLQPENNFFEGFDNSYFKKFRKYFIETILSTDMIYHAKINSHIKNKLSTYNIVNGKNIDLLIPEDENMYDSHQELFNFLLHVADISHNSKEFDISFEWVSLLQEEFYIQGDMEKSMGLTISNFCDRENSDVPKSQVGFLTYIISPSFEILQDLFPGLSFFMDNVEENISKWQEKVTVKDVHSKKESVENENENEKVESKVKINYNLQFSSITLDNDDFDKSSI